MSGSCVREVFTYGQNSYGELGHGDTMERHAPTLVAFCQEQGLSVVQVVAGNEHTALREQLLKQAFDASVFTMDPMPPRRGAF